MQNSRIVHMAVFMLAVLLVGVIVVAPTGASQLLAADDPPTPVIDTGKNEPRPVEPGNAPGEFHAEIPVHSSKNDGSVLENSSAGIGIEVVPSEGSKNYDASLNDAAQPETTTVTEPGSLPTHSQGLEEVVTNMANKNQPSEVESGTSPGFYSATLPEPQSKNYEDNTVSEGPKGEGLIVPAPQGSKNDASDTASLTNFMSDIASLTTIGSLLTCGESGNMDWTTASSSFSVIRQCSLTIPQDGWVFISTSASVARQNSAFEANFRIGIDNTGGDSNVDRWVNVYDDSGDGTDETMALSVIKPVTAGAHTFYMLGARYSGTGTVLVYDPTLTVVYVPAASATALSCGQSGNANWTTTSATFAVVRQCTLNVPQPGWVFLSTDASVARTDGEYEALFEIGIDSTSGDPNIDRWVNVYNDAADGTDKTVALSVLKNVTAGEHTFSFLARRYSGTGTVLAYDPTLSVLYVPATSATALACGASGNLSWSTTSSTFAVVRQCTLTMPQDGWVFMGADASLARSTGAYEAQFEMGIDSTAGDWNVDRWVNVYDDAGDGTDKSVALSVLKPLKAGTHIFYLLGKRYSGTGTVYAYDPTLTVIYPGANLPSVFLPLILK